MDGGTQLGKEHSKQPVAKKHVAPVAKITLSPAATMEPVKDDSFKGSVFKDIEASPKLEPVTTPQGLKEQNFDSSAVTRSPALNNEQLTVLLSTLISIEL